MLTAPSVRLAYNTSCLTSILRYNSLPRSQNPRESWPTHSRTPGEECNPQSGSKTCMFSVLRRCTSTAATWIRLPTDSSIPLSLRAMRTALVHLCDSHCWSNRMASIARIPCFVTDHYIPASVIQSRTPDAIETPRMLPGLRSVRAPVAIP